jgi:hypothetical protein
MPQVTFECRNLLIPGGLRKFEEKFDIKDLEDLERQSNEYSVEFDNSASDLMDSLSKIIDNASQVEVTRAETKQALQTELRLNSWFSEFLNKQRSYRLYQISAAIEMQKLGLHQGSRDCG